MNAVTQTRASGMDMVLRPQNFDQLMRFAELAASSAMVPASFKGKPADVMLAVQMGSELGLSPMQSLQNIACINGRPSVWGDAMLALVRNDPRCADVVETVSGEGEAMTATCIVKRRGGADIIRSFSVADAKKASLWGKQGPWQQYPSRMLAMRARGFALRDAFPDVLRGLISAEEARDTPTDSFKGTTLDAQPEPRQQPRAVVPDLDDSITALDESPMYPLVTREGTRYAASGAELIAMWAKTIKRMQTADAIGRLPAFADLNKAALLSIEAHDAKTAEQVRDLIAAALGEEPADDFPGVVTPHTENPTP